MQRPRLFHRGRCPAHLCAAAADHAPDGRLYPDRRPGGLEKKSHVGIVGYGAIGKQVAGIAKAFGMRIFVHNRSRINDETVTQVPLDTLLRESDVVSLHCPLNADSANMISAENLAKMKQGAVLLNTARGPLVDELALKDALVSGKLIAQRILSLLNNKE